MIALKKKRASVPKVARNGISMTKDDGSLYKAMIDMAKKQMDKPRLAPLLRKLAESTN